MRCPSPPNSEAASLEPSDISETSCEEYEDESDASITEEPQRDNASSNASVSSKNSSSSSSSSKKSVTFSPQLVVRTHALVVGDSPSCPLLPLQLDWDYNLATVDMDQYESSRRRPRRRTSTKSPRKLLFYERSERLEDVAGYSPKELLEHKKQALERIKQQKEQEAIEAQQQEGLLESRIGIQV